MANDCEHETRSWGVEYIGKQWHCPDCNDLVECVDFGEYQKVNDND